MYLDTSLLHILYKVFTRRRNRNNIANIPHSYRHGINLEEMRSLNRSTFRTSNKHKVITYNILILAQL